jgi:hypothetical protein
MLLMDPSKLDGLFLVRGCSASPDDFSLSIIANSNFYHYRIGHSIDAYYVLDDGKQTKKNKRFCFSLVYFCTVEKLGPLIHGLDELIKHYQYDPHGLPCKLNSMFVPNMTLPTNSRIIGNTNPLHIAASCVSEVGKVRMILNCPYRPDVNEKDENG